MRIQSLTSFLVIDLDQKALADTWLKAHGESEHIRRFDFTQRATRGHRPRQMISPNVGQIRAPKPMKNDSRVAADQHEVLAFLGDPSTHAIDGPVRRIDTHGAIVFLAGDNAYKVKRAVHFPYMDFSTLEKRRTACLREIEVNRLNAPGIYLGVIPITRAGASLEFSGSGEILEYCVHMRRFDEGATLDHLAGEGAFTPDLVASLARAVAQAHERAPRRDYDSAAALDGLIRENGESLAESEDLFSIERVRALTAASLAIVERNTALLAARRKAGFVRRCHGDLHLGNVVLLRGQPVLFDALEFDENMASIDVLYDLAYLIMDLRERGFPHAANSLFNQYLWQTDEAHLAGLAVMPLFLSLRAAIRAKVVAASLPYSEARQREGLAREAKRYFALAEEFLSPAAPRLVAIGGLSGAGKTTVAAEVAPSVGRPPGSVHLRTDIERKRLFGAAQTERLPQSDYRPDISAKVYAEVRRKAGIVLAAGYSVIADAVHARREEREAIEATARDAGARFDGLWLEVPLTLRIERVERRADDASDATAEVARRQADVELGDLPWARIEASGDAGSTIRNALDTLALSQRGQKARPSHLRQTPSECE
jgi:uncharacterized protein